MTNLTSQRVLTYPERLTRAGLYLANLLEEAGKPVITNFDFFQLVVKMYTETKSQKLYLRGVEPTAEQFTRLRIMLRKNGFIGIDSDYGYRVHRVFGISDQPAEDIVCLVDPTCYVSHLSAMQRWGLTDRKSSALLLTRPDRNTAKEALETYMKKQGDHNQTNPYPIQRMTHPEKVRRRQIRVFESKTAGSSIKDRRSDVRVSTIGQTFLDMVQKPELCGGMSHVLDVWAEHAKTHLSEVVQTVDTASSNLVKSRAGYILEERMGLNHNRIEAWKLLGQRGSSRKLDPTKAFESTFSETWMISINV